MTGWITAEGVRNYLNTAADQQVYEAICRTSSNPGVNARPVVYVKEPAGRAGTPAAEGIWVPINLREVHVNSKHSMHKELATKLVEAFMARDPEKIMSLYTDDFEVSSPFMFPKKTVVRGKRAAIEFLRTHPDAVSSRMYDNIRVKDFTVFETTDPEWFVMEFTYVSRIGNDEVENGNVCIVQVRDGKIFRSRDYHNHVTRAVAEGRVPELLETISGMQLEQDRHK
jgi:ketosteroid isomerase-like protein